MLVDCVVLLTSSRLIDWCGFSSAILSVLQTPPVVRKAASFLRDAGASVSVTKPQSILSAARHKTNAASVTTARLTWDGVYAF